MSSQASFPDLAHHRLVRDITFNECVASDVDGVVQYTSAYSNTQGTEDFRISEYSSWRMCTVLQTQGTGKFVWNKEFSN